ncbi:MAG: DNA-processing protein DprA [Clostridia bacterium]|nr:DNA-processing protein DprA [Clostridia bacterium]
MNYWIWLATVKGIGTVKKKALLERFKTPEKIYKAKKEELLQVEGITEKCMNDIENSKNIELIKKYEAYMEKNKIKIINIVDKEYPEKLRQIYDPPITLFCIGDITLLKKVSIGIIGSREPSVYGEKIATKFSKELSEKGITVVSGMAKGIDACGHIGALQASGKTIAVLGCGVDIVYPVENIQVYNSIAKTGLIISEYIVGTKPETWQFPARNRIISGLCNGVLVVEAKKKSGTMITTDFALEQGRELYVVPGNITSLNSEGTNKLMKEGAKIVTCIEDILEDFI